VAAIALVATAAPGEAVDHETLRSYLERVARSYFDVAKHYPSEYSCEMRSPELVASLDPRGKEAWGDGHVLVTKAPLALRLTAEGIAQPTLKPLFDLALGLWQLKLTTELAALYAYLPGVLTTLAGAAAMAPLTHEAFEEPVGENLRWGLTARSADHGIQEIQFETSPSFELREFFMRRKDRSELAVELESRRSAATGDLWVVTHLTARSTQPSGRTEVVVIDIDYSGVRSEQAVVLSRLAIRREDGAGRLLGKGPKDVNPISFEFRSYRF
jgi:hypothetical protein